MTADEIDALHERVKILERELTVAQTGLRAVDTLIRESYGVAGLYLNGDVADWRSLLRGGYYESWLE